MGRVKDKHLLYELSVQSPGWHVDWFESVFRTLRGRDPKSLREDFCGTFRLSAEWVLHDASHSALALDLDTKTLQSGKRRHWKPLSSDQKRRLQVREQDVLVPTDEKVDLIAACNFSFNIFKQRKVLTEYFRACLKSLKRDGILVLEVAGGPGMIGKMRERKTVRTPGIGLPSNKFVYVWDQKEFDPITHDVLYAIHFQFADGTQMRDAFVYDWRLWTLPELRETLLEAGFSDVKVFWETEHQGQGTGEYLAAEHGDNAYSWIAYAVGVK